MNGRYLAPFALPWRICAAALAMLGDAPAMSTAACRPGAITIGIVDESGGRELAGTDFASMANSPFKDFVSHVVAEVSAERARDCGATGLAAAMTLRFVYRPLWVERPLSTTPKGPAATLPPGPYRLRSPWVTLTAASPAGQAVTATFLWSERQFLVDQAIMAGVRVNAGDSLGSFTKAAYDGFVESYASLVLSADSPSSRADASRRLAVTMPPELYWLLRNAWQSTLAPFEVNVRSARRKLLQRAGPAYQRMAMWLFSQGLKQRGASLQYGNVTDITNTAVIDDYRVKQVR